MIANNLIKNRSNLNVVFLDTNLDTLSVVLNLDTILDTEKVSFFNRNNEFLKPFKGVKLAIMKRGKI